MGVLLLVVALVATSPSSLQTPFHRLAMSKRSILPLFDRVLVRKAKPQQSIGGILLPEAAQKRLNEGTVIAVGAGRRTYESPSTVIPPVVKEGDVVLLSEYGGTEIEIEGEKLSLYREEDLLGILKESSA